MLGALAAPRDDSLDALLGDVAAGIVRDELLAGARRWSAEVAPGAAYEANLPGAVPAALAGHDGPVLLIAPDVPMLDVFLATEALKDLADGADLVVGTAFDGTPYLLAMPTVDSGLLDLLGRPREEVLAEAGSRGGGLGMVPTQRRLVSAADAHAFAADPMLPLELAVPLAAGCDVRVRRGA